MEIQKENLKRINVAGMSKTWMKETALLPDERRHYEGHNMQNAALMTLHIRPTSNAAGEIRNLLNEMFNGISMYYNGFIHSSEFHHGGINVDEKRECYPEIYFENISDKAVHALGKISDIIIEKYNGSQWFMLEMLKVAQIEAECEPVYYGYDMSYDENPFGTKAADFCM